MCRVAQRYDGIHKTAVEVTGSNGTKLDQYWENGPQLSGWGQIVGKYPDGTTAIAQGKSGKGWVILSGVHAEAPQSWRGGMTFTTSAAVDNAYAKTLVTAALNGTSLPHFRGRNRDYAQSCPGFNDLRAHFCVPSMFDSSRVKVPLTT
jgi:hypothetical protein